MAGAEGGAGALPALRVLPHHAVRVWGGTRLAAPGPDGPVGEAWVAGPAVRSALPGGGPGPTLDELAAREGRRLVGEAAAAPDRFPLLVKLLDPAAWLSVQVHPDDAAAARLAGPGAVGKTEAWYVLDAAPGASILLGARPEAPAEAIRAAIADGDVTPLLERRRVAAGDVLLVPAGTLHAIGPGVLLYELQQPSDLTYRVHDWGRAPTADRALHRAEALASVDPGSRPAAAAVPFRPGRRGRLVAAAPFVLEHLDAAPGAPVAADPGGRSLHVLTAADGTVTVTGAGWRHDLGLHATLVVPASAGAYAVAAPAGPARVLLARLPEPGEVAAG